MYSSILRASVRYAITIGVDFSVLDDCTNYILSGLSHQSGYTSDKRVATWQAIRLQKAKRLSETPGHSIERDCISYYVSYVSFRSFYLGVFSLQG